MVLPSTDCMLMHVVKSREQPLFFVFEQIDTAALTKAGEEDSELLEERIFIGRAARPRPVDEWTQCKKCFKSVRAGQNAEGLCRDCLFNPQKSGGSDTNRSGYDECWKCKKCGQSNSGIHVACTRCKDPQPAPIIDIKQVNKPAPISPRKKGEEEKKKVPARTLKPEEWICEVCSHINSMPNYVCKSILQCFHTVDCKEPNKTIRELVFLQRQQQERSAAKPQPPRTAAAYDRRERVSHSLDRSSSKRVPVCPKCGKPCPTGTCRECAPPATAPFKSGLPRTETKEKAKRDVLRPMTTVGGTKRVGRFTETPTTATKPKMYRCYICRKIWPTPYCERCQRTIYT